MKYSTPLKNEIIDLLKKHHLLSAPQIVAMLHQKGMELNKTTVYRNLSSFLEDGLICQQSFGDNEFFYELRDDHHDHLLCQSCGLIQETPCVIKTPAHTEGFAIDHHHLTLYGMCVNCQKTANDK